MGFKHSRIAKPFSNFSICLLSPEGLGAWLDSLRKCNNCITSTTSKVAYFFQSLPLQDNYTLAQPGIQTKIMRLKDLIARLDGVCVCGRVCVCVGVCVGGHVCGVTEVYLASLWQGSLAAHLSNHSVEYIQFSFRWMNNLLMREFPLRCIIRLWDSYLVSAPLPPPATHTCTHTLLAMCVTCCFSPREMGLLPSTSMCVQLCSSGSLRTFKHTKTFRYLPTTYLLSCVVNRKELPWEYHSLVPRLSPPSFPRMGRAWERG